MTGERVKGSRLQGLWVQTANPLMAKSVGPIHGNMIFSPFLLPWKWEGELCAYSATYYKINHGCQLIKVNIFFI